MTSKKKKEITGMLSMTRIEIKRIMEHSKHQRELLARPVRLGLVEAGPSVTLVYVAERRQDLVVAPSGWAAATFRCASWPQKQSILR